MAVSMNIILKGQLAFMNQYFDVVGVTGYHEKHVRDIVSREGVRVHTIEIARAISPWRDMVALWKLYRFFRLERPDMVHTHTPKAGLLGMLAAWLARVPVRLHTVAGLPLMEVTGIRRVVLNIAERVTYFCAHRIYPNSRGLHKVILDSHFCDAEKLKVLANGASNGINVDFFKPDYAGDLSANRQSLRKQYGVHEHEIVFCLVSRIAREKGIKELLEAFLSMRTAGMPIKLLLIGTFEEHYGKPDEETKSIISTHPDIISPGRFDDVRPFYSMSDIYVFPSYREGFPNSLMEAGAMGLPSIATDINGCNEIIEPGVNGILIPVKSVDALQREMTRLVQDVPLRKQLASAARPMITERFNRELIWKAMLEDYQSMLKMLCPE
jgi:glycosyltransferase involved in cell wall biosynthesis